VHVALNRPGATAHPTIVQVQTYKRYDLLGSVAGAFVVLLVLVHGEILLCKTVSIESAGMNPAVCDRSQSFWLSQLPCNQRSACRA
jgi:hypothetical protein